MNVLRVPRERGETAGHGSWWLFSATVSVNVSSLVLVIEKVWNAYSPRGNFRAVFKGILQCCSERMVTLSLAAWPEGSGQPSSVQWRRKESSVGVQGSRTGPRGRWLLVAPQAHLGSRRHAPPTAEQPQQPKACFYFFIKVSLCGDPSLHVQGTSRLTR